MKKLKGLITQIYSSFNNRSSLYRVAFEALFVFILYTLCVCTLKRSLILVHLVNMECRVKRKLKDKTDNERYANDVHKFI